MANKQQVDTFTPAQQAAMQAVADKAARKALMLVTRRQAAATALLPTPVPNPTKPRPRPTGTQPQPQSTAISKKLRVLAALQTGPKTKAQLMQVSGAANETAAGQLVADLRRMHYSIDGKGGTFTLVQ